MQRRATSKSAAMPGCAEDDGAQQLRLLEPPTRFYQASSSEAYASTPPPQNQDTPLHPRFRCTMETQACDLLADAEVLPIAGVPHSPHESVPAPTAAGCASTKGTWRCDVRVDLRRAGDEAAAAVAAERRAGGGSAEPVRGGRGARTDGCVPLVV